MITNELVDIAVEWWADKIENFHPHDNGALDEKPSRMACAFADMEALNSLPSAKQLKEFKQSLKDRILNESKRYDQLRLYCDYGPGYILSDAAKDAGLNFRLFPYKTGMIITEKEVKVSNGYRQSYEIIH